MARKVADLKSFSLTQFLNKDYWLIQDIGFTKALEDKDLIAITKAIVERLESNGWGVEEAYSIIHDKDTREVWSETGHCLVEDYKDAHIHMSVSFKKGQNIDANVVTIGSAIGVESQYVEKPKPGMYSWDNQLSYLVHAKDLDKFQYTPYDVYTYKGKDYESIYQESIARWERGAIKKTNKKAKEDIDFIESEILQGRMTKSQILLTDEYYQVYALNKRRIDDAFDTHGQRKMYKALQMLENGEFKVTVHYITGPAGTGKTMFANDLINDIKRQAKEATGEDWTVCKTASTNPVDDYQGEEMLLMDDVRGSSMRADDWLKLLDPYNISPSGARYRNKVVSARTIIITATIHPTAFFYMARENNTYGGNGYGEAVDQFLRRLHSVVKIHDINSCTIERPRVTTEAERKTLVKRPDLPYNYSLDPDNNLPEIVSTGDAIKIISSEIIESNSLKQ